MLTEDSSSEIYASLCTNPSLRDVVRCRNKTWTQA